MKILSFAFLAAFAATALVGTQASANLLANPSFEQPITQDGPPFVGLWEGFNGGAGSSAANGTASPRTGAMELDLRIDGVNNTFAGAFQDVPGLVPGTPVVFSGWHKKGTDPVDLGIEFRIEWRNSVSDTEITRTANFTDAPGADYIQFNLPSVVPGGVDTARVVYAIQTFGGEPGPTNTGLVYVDDLSFRLPEPTTAMLVGVAATGLVFARRRRA